ncbi:hypothetical protein OTU49_004672, partial [Cherax quadricarinatus]
SLHKYCSIDISTGQQCTGRPGQTATCRRSQMRRRGPLIIASVKEEVLIKKKMAMKLNYTLPLTVTEGLMMLSKSDIFFTLLLVQIRTVMPCIKLLNGVFYQSSQPL